ncbi:unnamed protein product, partial [Prorocentrum cordatum]
PRRPSSTTPRCRRLPRRASCSSARTSSGVPTREIQMKLGKHVRHWPPCVAVAYQMNMIWSCAPVLPSLQRRQLSGHGAHQMICCAALWTVKAPKDVKLSSSKKAWTHSRSNTAPRSKSTVSPVRSSTVSSWRWPRHVQQSWAQLGQLQTGRQCRTQWTGCSRCFWVLHRRLQH